jgi:hypothetical protein
MRAYRRRSPDARRKDEERNFQRDLRKRRADWKKKHPKAIPRKKTPKRAYSIDVLDIQSTSQLMRLTGMNGTDARACMLGSRLLTLAQADNSATKLNKHIDHVWPKNNQLKKRASCLTNSAK